MEKKPPIDRRGSHLTPGERFKNWCAGVVQIWPIVLPLLAGTVYGNSATIQSLVHGKPLEQVEDAPAEIVSGGLEEQVNVAIRNVNLKLQELKERDAALSKQISSQRAQIALIEESLEEADIVNTAELQAQIDYIKGLVQ
jgi:hypothetical protein